MSFVQIIEYETDRPDEMQALSDAMMAKSPELPPGFRVVVGKDRDQPDRYFSIVEFASYEAAQANNARPEVDEFAKQMAAMCTSPPRFYNLDVVATGP